MRCCRLCVSLTPLPAFPPPLYKKQRKSSPHPHPSLSLSLCKVASGQSTKVHSLSCALSLSPVFLGLDLPALLPDPTSPFRHPRFRSWLSPFLFGLFELLGLRSEEEGESKG